MLTLDCSHVEVNTSDIIGRPRLSGIACENTVSLLRRWVAACKDRHSLCSVTLSGEVIDETHPATILPHRVLRVDNARVRIVQSKRRHGCYAALSHCWGPPEKRPIRSLKTNIENFEREIPWSLLPKTYQDAIIIVRSMDIPYIWIDSLCIVQDDRDDWMRESLLMGSIYERAEFTIAASHAHQSSEGFLHLRPDPLSAAVELPNFLCGSSGTESISPPSGVFARIREDTIADAFPENGALNQRSWATQEWLLSRRMMFFTPATIMWSCKNITQRETGERCFNISRNVRWKTVIEAYSERKLTFPTDRLVALEGLQTELQKKLNYTYLSGIWEENLPDQLLWQVAHRLEAGDVVNPLGLPTWTWGRVPCGVRFLQINKAKNMCHLISASDCKLQLTIRSRMKVLPMTTSFDKLDGNPSSDVIANRIFSDITSSHAKATSSLARIIVDGTRPIGWVVYDEQPAEQKSESSALTPYYMLALMSSLGRREDEANRLHDNPAVKAKSCQYWCLVLQKGKEDDRYYRVGVGKSYLHEWWLSAGLQNVRLS